MLWLQGWDQAPAVARAAQASWTGRNPGWKVQALDRVSLAHFLPADCLERIFATPKPPETLSDQIRLELLHRYGGVWADATTICARPLEDWLPAAMPRGFFAFARPGPGRMLSNWFLAAEKGSYILERWRAAGWAYWQDRQKRDNYFWQHGLFAEIYAQDPGVRALWDETPERPANHPFHFSPDAPALIGPPPAGIETILADPPAPVFKLTHKFKTPPGPGSLMRRLCAFGRETSPPLPAPIPRPRRALRLLVGGAGSFAGQGTLGDLRALESVASHLVARGHEVMHATALPLTIAGAVRVDWQKIETAQTDAVIFVCGSIPTPPPRTRAFLDRFQDGRLVGVGGSPLPEGHAEHHTPFRKVFARRGGFGDVAIAAPLPPHPPVRRGTAAGAGAGRRIGLALREPQDDDPALFAAVTAHLAQEGPLDEVRLDSALAHPGRRPEETEADYAACDLVLTTCFQGAITALRHGVPFIALDERATGAGLAPLQGLGWPGLFTAPEARLQDLLPLARDLLARDQTLALCRARSRALRAANQTLCALSDWLETQRPSSVPSQTGPLA